MTVSIGTPLKSNASRAMLLGGGELGKEVAIELQRYGIEVIVVDRYKAAPAMQVAHRSHVINMLDPVQLRKVIEEEAPHFIIPEIEAIATAELLDLEREGFNVVPSAGAANLTMNREGIRRLAAEELGIKTSPYRFAANKEAFLEAVETIGFPCVVKPIMSSSGKGQSVLRSETDIECAWQYAQEGGRAGHGKVIVEGFVEFDYEITLLTVRHSDGVSFCEPIGHRQIDGDYRASWQPQSMSSLSHSRANEVADTVTAALGGYGVFGVELFIKGDEVYFSEVSPRPHDTDLVTLISQDQSEFCLHVKALLGLPVPAIEFYGPSASEALLIEGSSDQVTFSGLEDVVNTPGVELRLFGKPEVKGKRRMGVVLARGGVIPNLPVQLQRKKFRKSLLI
ncbi:formate-dependent phosphoribosylglycinamide formyltransferase [Hahella ganghwensis]|uniref:formate-dependent phosphoribosylglycinamide formyltransferase n=1 Tax=Hahella ganghwensis TaxID=286420 RepID=UPI0003754A8E|nr:formate-dependent phosphoribosylglycinamide formyltransferase [Hahella ganghwensis]